MKNKHTKYHSLSRRIVSQFCIFTLVLSSIYGLFCFLFLYDLEDEFIYREIKQEADYLSTQYNKTGDWPVIRNAYMTLHFSKKTLPKDMQPQSFEEPSRKEFYGEQGRHYHLHALVLDTDSVNENPTKANQVYLLAEVSSKLMVRPIKAGVFSFLLISALFLTLIACFIAWRLGRKTAKPLKQLADLVDGVAPEKIPKQFAHHFPKNEIGILADTLEQTMTRMDQALAREKCFTRDVSHELRTPVAIVKNATELYQTTAMEAKQVGALIERIAQAGSQMEQTVTTLLMLAREEQTAAQKEDTGLLALIEQSIIDNSYLIAKKEINVMVDDNCQVSLFSQPGMVKVLLDNLISNAFQYTEKGTVKVSFVGATLIIEDNGPGIEPSISNKITEPAIKGEQSTGYGFGLSIVKRLCEHQNWQLTMQSNEAGTKISVSFE
ncbi:MAG: ATP-binding protein [Colwellia sp.]